MSHHSILFTSDKTTATVSATSAQTSLAAAVVYKLAAASHRPLHDCPFLLKGRCLVLATFQGGFQMEPQDCGPQILTILGIKRRIHAVLP